MAAERLTLDLSECDLLEVPPEAFDITNLEASRICDWLVHGAVGARPCSTTWGGGWLALGCRRVSVGCIEMMTSLRFEHSPARKVSE